jgi:hypothetical protein
MVERPLSTTTMPSADQDTAGALIHNANNTKTCFIKSCMPLR